ncbi:MAG: hypothetical protein IPH75_08160 [bacterium]|nr:hypothetical protein [bacterium]
MPVSNAERLNYNDGALYCYGTAYIFECRIRPLEVAINLLTFTGFLGPMIAGVTVTSVSTSGQVAGWVILVIWFAVALSAIHVLLSLWALVQEWLNQLAFYKSSMVENYQLSSELEDLAKNTLLSDIDWRNRAAILDERGKYRQKEDLHQNITEDERRMGMRYALRKFKRACSGCGKIPTSIVASDCDICGSFKMRSFQWPR